MTAKALMLQGTASDVGKSVLVAALCRLAKRRGINVAPFKPQNMSNNAAACPGGGEIGRAQALQALAAGLDLDVHFNPVLLKPSSDCQAQVVVHGKALGSQQASDYMLHGRQQLLDAVLTSANYLNQHYDLVLVEGAGSPAEVKLRAGDIANMGFARAANVPVCLVGDIDRGGVIASVVGTQRVIAAEDANMIKAFLINRFRGDPRLFDDGVQSIEAMTGWPCLGVIPWLNACAALPAEDAVTLEKPNRKLADQPLRIVAPMLSRIANADDTDPLVAEPGVDFRWIPPGQAIPRDTDVVLLLGTKSSLSELDFLRAQGWHHDIQAHVRTGGHVMGICGGYQMLGQSLEDATGNDGQAGSRKGLGLLDISTTMQQEKTNSPITATCLNSEAPLAAYEIHVGTTQGPDGQRPLFRLADGRLDGASSPDGHISGTYLHGLFANDTFRRHWLTQLHATFDPDYSATAAVQCALDELADGVEAAVNVDRLLALATPIQQAVRRSQ